MRISSASLSAMAGFLFFAENASYSCDCVAPPEVQVAFDQADAVFVGTVVSQGFGNADASGPRRVNFQVTQSWKGVTGTQVGAITPRSCGECGFKVSKGDEFLVYGSLYFEGDYLEFNICQRTDYLTELPDDVTMLAAIGIEPLKLDPGNDPAFPRLAIRGSGSSFCGIGTLPLLWMSGLLLFKLPPP